MSKEKCEYCEEETATKVCFVDGEPEISFCDKCYPFHVEEWLKRLTDIRDIRSLDRYWAKVKRLEHAAQEMKKLEPHRMKKLKPHSLDRSLNYN